MAIRVPDPLRPAWQLAQQAEAEYRKTRSPLALDESLQLWESLLSHTALMHSQPDLHAGFLNARNILLVERYQEKHHWEDLRQAIHSWETLVRRIQGHSPPDGASEHLYAGVYYGNLGAALLLSFQIEPDHEILGQAVAFLESACFSVPARQVPVHDVYRLSKALSIRSQQLRRTSAEDLEKSVDLARRALDLTETDNIQTVSFLAQLGTSLLLRHRSRGHFADLEEGLAALRQSLKATSNEDRAYRARASELGRAYLDRFLVLGDMDDLRRALAVLEDAASRPHHDPSLASCLSNLGVACCLWYDHTRAPEHLHRGLQALMKSIEVTTLPGIGSAGLPHYVQALGFGLSRRLDSDTKTPFLGPWIQTLESMLSALPAEATVRPLLHASLSHAYGMGVRQGRPRSWSDSALQHAFIALGGLPESHPDRYLLGVLVADSLRLEYDSGGEIAALEQAIEGFRLSSRLLLERAPARAIETALVWGDWAFVRESWQEAREAYALVFAGLALVLDRQIVRPAREAWLGKIQGLASRAAYAAARAGHLDMAVLALEQGHARLLADQLRWTESMSEALRSLHPRHWMAYQRAVEDVQKLEQQLLDTPLPTPGPWPESLGLDRDDQLRQLRQQVFGRMQAIRELDGFADFALPTGLADVQRNLAERETPCGQRGAGNDRVLVYLAATTAGTLLLWLDGHETGQLFLDVTLYDLDSWLEDSTDSSSGFTKPLSLENLSALGNRIAKPLALHPRIQRASGVILVPVGPLGGVPIHTAPFSPERSPGSKDSGSTCLAFEQRISFQPNGSSVSAADRATRTLGSEQALGRRMLVVGEAGLASWFQHMGTDPDTLGIECKALPLGKAHTRNLVLQDIVEATHVHFGCHGCFDPKAPMESWLDLGHGERLTLDDLMEHSADWRPPKLVFLAACESGVRDRRHLPDELISLPGALIHRGVSCVIATLWPVDSVATGLLTSRFYELLFLESHHPAAALGSAQKWLRDLSIEDLTTLLEGPNTLTTSWAERAMIVHGLGEDLPFAKPEFWSGFILLGNP